MKKQADAKRVTDAELESLLKPTNEFVVSSLSLLFDQVNAGIPVQSSSIYKGAMRSRILPIQLARIEIDGKCE